ncbi:twin-arginine translocase subunit TatC [Alkalicoccobacillus murimartini]|uniref:Sec-independent protein translocase protein TatC n=1 Tax=Alkalicoccobacillus murimartini TaxID=171685 RepID=A0ABT9YL07_9BACI|nr:twin-arginine translocase subunit TatC [Alkalicoccobacillus murimartini]MDQ0208538.1 sec-independent protein translocase protein TatC [Alkalicoccobacillus murimartini]
MKEQDMAIWAHLEELRRRLFIVLVFFVMALIVGFFISSPLITLLQQTPEARDLPMNAFKMTDPLRIFMTFTFAIGIVLIFPVVLYQLWAFVKPGLHEKEQKATLAYIPIAFVLFLVGIAFAYFVLFPFMLSFMASMAERLDITEQYGINEYFSFLFQLILPFGALFQLPVVVMFLTRIGLITPDFLRKIRKYAYFVLLIIAGLITPPDLFSHLMVTVPLLLLYEMSIWLSKLTHRRYKTSDEATLSKKKK